MPPGRTLAVLIGRFQPPHAAHLHLIETALARHSHLLILLGSANLTRSVVNPWTAAERARLIRASLPATGRLSLVPLADEFDAARWAASVRAAVQQKAAQVGTQSTVLTGFEKDASSVYLRWFPEWTLDPSPAHGDLNATAVRAALFGQGQVPAGLPDGVTAALNDFLHTSTFCRLQAEFQAVQAERTRLSAAQTPVPRTEVLHLHQRGGQVWLVRRAGPVGAGLLALPGEIWPSDSPLPVAVATFAHPARSLVWPAVAQVQLDPAPVPGSRPYHLDTVLRQPRAFFEDHHVILRRLCGPAADRPA
ncbi:adenylyltransferase/cytidyltransferase family protein [Deinococcus sp. HMF7604]|uniref:adenylyltransferase/cytidyltransferase family protein n=1 Tax=Deinococcus betulae TaxID=2873312 RepID=UPI001CCBEA99|nr:adenylyltransferase/cytidyltransferase family protein [Deinococcus betulae]